MWRTNPTGTPPPDRRPLEVYDDRRVPPFELEREHGARADAELDATRSATPALDDALASLFDAAGRDALSALDTVAGALAARAAAAAAALSRGLDGSDGARGAFDAGAFDAGAGAGAGYSRYEFRSASRAVGHDGRVTERVVETTRIGDEEPVTRTVTREPGGAEVVTVTRGARVLGPGEDDGGMGAWAAGRGALVGADGAGPGDAATNGMALSPFAPAERVREMFRSFFDRRNERGC